MAVWVVIITWCGFVLLRPEIGDQVGRASLEMMGLMPEPAATWASLARPAGHAGSPAPADDDQAAALLAGQLPGDCPLAGITLRVTLGPEGLATAEALGPAPTCAAAAVWGAAWPRMPAPVTVELSVSGA